MARDGDGDVPAGRWQRAELRQRHLDAAAERVPARLRRRLERGERRAIVARIERRVRLHHAQDGPHGLGDAPTFGSHVVLDAAADPDAGDVLINDQTESMFRAHGLLITGKPRDFAQDESIE